MKAPGFEIIRNVFNEAAINSFREEADRVALAAKSSCVRHLREKSDLFKKLSTSQELVRLFPEALCPVRSILFDKTPTENWPVAWHQDLTIAVGEKQEIDGYGPWSVKDGAIHVQPPVELLKKMRTIRIHLDDTPAANGALRVIPQTHTGIIPQGKIPTYTDDSEVLCECRAGDILIMSPLILHASKRSQNPSRRRIIHFEYAPVDSLDPRLSWYDR